MIIRYSRDAVKAIERMDRATKQRIRQGIEGLTRIPPDGDIKPMQGFSDRRLRLRIGGYRIIYRIDQPLGSEQDEREKEPVLWIIDIGARGDIYK